MKKAYLIVKIMLIISLLSACTNSGHSEDPLPSEINSSTPSQTIPDIKSKLPMNIILTRSMDDMMTDEDVDNWEKYIVDKYDVSLNLCFIKTYWQSDVMMGRAKKVGIDIEEMKNISDDGGFIYLGSITQLKELADSGLIKPVNDYLKDLPLMANLDDSIKSTFMDHDGTVWAFPMYNNSFASCMVYNGDWINNFGQGVPSDIDSYLKMAKYIKSKDPNTYMQTFKDSSVMKEFNQIFKAFGCYPDSSWAIGYNPQIGMYENAVLNENFPEAIRFIKYMYDMEMIYNLDQGKDQSLLKVFAAKNGSDSTKYFGEATPCYYLEGINTTELVEVKTNPMCFAVLSGTENVQEKLQTFINMVLSDEYCYMDLFAGIEGASYKIHEEYYTYERIDEEGNKINKPSILVKLESSEQKPYYASDLEELSSYAKFYDQAQEFSNDVEQFLDSNLVYTRRLSDYNPEIKTLNNNIVQLTNNLMRAIIFEDADIEAAIEEYREKVKYVSEQLNEINTGLYN